MAQSVSCSILIMSRSSLCFLFRVCQAHSKCVHDTMCTCYLGVHIMLIWSIMRGIFSCKWVAIHHTKSCWTLHYSCLKANEYYLPKQDLGLQSVITLYTSGYGLLQKIIVFEELTATKCFLLVKMLDSAPQQLCSDEVTHAQLDRHLCMFHPPRLAVKVSSQS